MNQMNKKTQVLVKRFDNKIYKSWYLDIEIFEPRISLSSLNANKDWKSFQGAKNIGERLAKTLSAELVIKDRH